jgi:hypothetical protein
MKLMFNGTNWRYIALVLALFVAPTVETTVGRTNGPAAAALKHESFDKDPDWEGSNNRLIAKSGATIDQDFGYSETSFASKTKGEIGGLVWRAPEPAWYAEKIAPKTLNDKLTASGTFAITAAGGGGHVFFGWFNSKQEEGASRAVGSLGMEIGTDRIGGRVHVRLHSAENQSAGMVVQPGDVKKSKGPFHSDGTRYTWKLDYDPRANAGSGRVTFTFHSNLARPEPFESKTYVLDLPAGIKKQGTVFDRFGMMNGTKPGGHETIYFGDLATDGRALDLSKDPGWDAIGNRAAHSRTTGGENDFGFTNTDHAGGKPGEIGGAMWRTGKRWGYYADRVGPLSLDERMEARGKVLLEVGAPDSGMYFGWFQSGSNDAAPDHAGSFLGVKVAGPSRVGHYFAPAYATAKGTARAAGKGPLLVPGRTYDWALAYDPTANDGLGAIRVTLGRESATFNFKKGDKAEGGHFDRFGLFTLHNDGGHGQVKIFFDDLKYTVAGPAR